MKNLQALIDEAVALGILEKRLGKEGLAYKASTKIVHAYAERVQRMITEREFKKDTDKLFRTKATILTLLDYAQNQYGQPIEDKKLHDLCLMLTNAFIPFDEKTIHEVREKVIT